MNNTSSLKGARTTILLSCTIAVVITIITAVYTGEMLYLIASGLFAIAGGAGVFVVRALAHKIERGA